MSNTLTKGRRILVSFFTLARIPPTLARSLRVMSLRRIVVPCQDDPSKARTLGTQGWGGTPGDPGVGGPPGGPWGREGAQGRLRRPWGPWGPLGLFRSYSEWMAIPSGWLFRLAVWEGAQNAPKSISVGRRPKCPLVNSYAGVLGRRPKCPQANSKSVSRQTRFRV